MKVAVVALALVACGVDDRSPVPDELAGVKVTGCDDSALWPAVAIHEGASRAYVEGGYCGIAQYPLHRGFAGWWDDLELTPAERARLDRTCWRVTAAPPDSGWAVGDTFEGDENGAAFSIKGFDRAIELDGRVLRDDGTIMFSLAPTEVALDKAVVIDPDAADTTFVVSPESWAEQDAVHVFGTDVPTDEIVDASGSSQGFVLHRTATGFVRRIWGKTGDTIDFDEVALGSGTRARMALHGHAVVLDRELLFIEWRSASNAYEVVRRTPLATEPLAINSSYYHVALQVPGALEIHSLDGTTTSLPIGDAFLVANAYAEQDMVFDGASFRRLETTQNGNALGAPITPRPEDLAAIGAVRGVYHGIVFGERGLLHLDSTRLPGPRVATFADLFGDPDARLGPVASDTAAYVIRFGDGSAKLYNAPYSDFCD